MSHAGMRVRFFFFFLFSVGFPDFGFLCMVCRGVIINYLVLFVFFVLVPCLCFRSPFFSLGVPHQRASSFP